MSRFAIAQYEEPHAWLLRGLVEYGWTEGAAGIPPSPGQYDLRPWVASAGRDGLRLRVAAEADGRGCGDEPYELTVQLLAHGSRVLVRGADCNLLQEVPFDPANPLHAAGHITQLLGTYVPDFVRWRQQGNDLALSQRRGLPNPPGDAASTAFTQFVGERARVPRAFDAGPRQGWWIDVGAVGAPAGPPAGTPIAWAGQAGKAQPRGGRIGSAEPSRIEALARTLRGVAILGALTGLLAGLNVLATLVLFGVERPEALALNTLAALFLVPSGLLAWVGGGRVRDLRGGPLAWWAIAYPALVPTCCGLGPLVALWAAWRWSRRHG